MVIKFFNSLTNKKEVFKPINEKEVKIYSCGPTVYNFVHIGNLRSFVFMDVLVKTLKYFNYKVINVMNLTDVDDKTIRDSLKWNKDKSLSPNDILKKFTEIYTNYFFEDISKLNVEKPMFTPKATETISEMEFLINELYKKGYAYISTDGIYFNISKDKNYGHFIDVDFSKQKKNVENRLINDEYDKENIADFALWKFYKNGEPSWVISVGGKEYRGRPGWHIECSAMSYKFLGKKFDIHTGGIDLKFPHHENEIAQSSCALDIDVQANYWLHNEHLLVNGRKMSKSLGNFFTLRDLEDKGFSPLALRETYLRTHYRQQLNFTFESLQTGQKNVEKINDFYNKIKSIKPADFINENLNKLLVEKKSKFEEGLKDDLNLPKSLSAIYELVHEFSKNFDHINLSLKNDLLNFLEKSDNVLSLLIKDSIPKEIKELAEKRLEYRRNKDWDNADKLRNLIEQKGYKIKDLKDSYIITKI